MGIQIDLWELARQASPRACCNLKVLRQPGGEIDEFSIDCAAEVASQSLQGARQLRRGHISDSIFSQLVQVVSSQIPWCEECQVNDHWFLHQAVPLNDTVMIFAEDITSQKEQEALGQLSEARTRRLNQVYEMLSLTQAAVLQARGEDELFPLLCQIAVDHGGLALAWVGVADPITQEIVPVASSGQTQGYLENLHVSSRADDPLGRGPTGTALREGRSIVVSDFAAAPLTGSWHDLGKRFGIGTSAAFPLERGNKTCAVFTIYHQTPGAFDKEMVALIQRLCDSVSYALEHFQREDLRAESERKFRTIFETMHEGYVQARAGGSITMVNPAAVAMLGYANAEELLTVPPVELFYDASEFYEFRKAVAETGEVIDRHIRVRRKDGSVRLFFGSGRIHRGTDGQPTLLETAFRDVTEQVQAEDERRARLAADEANRLKSQFLATMSHEIRTPLNAVLGLAHLALQTELSPRQRDYLEKILQSGHGLLLTVNDILDFSKVEAGRLELERVDMELGDVLEEVAVALAGRAVQKGLELLFSVSPEVPTKVLGDPLRLAQVLINLVGNAIKFTEHGEVNLSLGLADRDNDPEEAVRLQFAVSDTGIGLTVEQIDRLFVSFSQGDSSTTRKYGGSGLGLSICDRLVRLMGGEISVSSHCGEGSTFTFTGLFGRYRGSDSPPPLPQLAGARALIIDDRTGERSQLVRMLQRLSLEVHYEADGDSALAHVQNAPGYRLILIGWDSTGKLSGAELCRQLHSLVDAQQTDILALVPFGQAVNGLTSASLHRPVTSTQLRARLATLLTDGRQPPSEGELRRVLQGGRVLLVEDNLINQQVARELLESAGLVVDVAADGQEAVRLLTDSPECPWQAILMDLHMPVMDGYTAARTIRSQPRFSQLPILALTAHVLSEERQRCQDAGMNDYISKPIDPEQLFSVLGRWLPGLKHLPKLSPAEPFPAIEGTDVARGLARVAGNSGLYRSLLLDFARQEKITGQALQAALASQDEGLLERTAHLLQGVAGNLGIEALAAQAEQLQSLGHQGLMAQAAQTLVTLLGSLQRVCTAILSMPGGNDPPRAEAKVDDLAGEVKQLAAYLENGDGQALDCLNRLMPALSGRAPDQALTRLQELVQRFDFEAALEELKKLG